MCDYGRLNFHYLHSADRLINPTVKGPAGNEVAPWEIALSRATSALSRFRGDEVAIIASGSLTNEEFFLTKRLAEAFGTTLHDIIPQTGEGDKILLSADRTANTAGAKLTGVASGMPGSRLGMIASGLKNKTVKALIVLGEDATKVLGEEIANAQCIVAMNLLPNGTTKLAHYVFPSCGFAEKRGSMINKTGRLQRLNRAVEPPGAARDDWEILRDLIQGISGANGIYTIEDVFKQMAAAIPVLNGLNLGKIGDLGVALPLGAPEGHGPPRRQLPIAKPPDS